MLEARVADLARAERDSSGHLSIEAHAIVWRRGIDGCFAGGAHHSAVVHEDACFQSKVAVIGDGQTIDILAHRQRLDGSHLMVVAMSPASVVVSAEAADD